MKYTSEIEINRPVDKVVALFDNPDNLYQWMEGLQHFEHLSGTPGQPGARSKLSFKIGNRQMEMIETITVRNLPLEFSGTYEAPGFYNVLVNRFLPAGENKTRYISEQEFRFSGIMKIVAFLMPGSFKKQSRKHLEAFRSFAEKAP